MFTYPNAGGEGLVNNIVLYTPVADGSRYIKRNLQHVTRKNLAARLARVSLQGGDRHKRLRRVTGRGLYA